MEVYLKESVYKVLGRREVDEQKVKVNSFETHAACEMTSTRVQGWLVSGDLGNTSGKVKFLVT